MKPARGTYRYWRDGRAQDVVEPWEVTVSGTELVLRGQRIVGGQPLLDVTARYHGDACEEFTVTWQPDARTVGYRRSGAQLEWSEGKGAQRREAIPDGSLLFPLLRAATGALLPRLALQACVVVLPDIRDPAGPGFLQPLQSQRHALQVSDGPRHYRYYGGEYGEVGADYWLDPDGFVQRYRWPSPQGLWEIALER